MSYAHLTPLLGARRRPPDPRERRYRAQLSATTVPQLDREVSIAPWLGSDVEDQQQIGACTAHATTRAIEALAARAGIPIVQLSRLWLYYQARARQGWQDQDSGAYLADACDVARDTGVPAETLWPYVPGLYATPPPDAATADAPGHRLAFTHQPIYATDPGGMTAGIWSALAAGDPVVIGMDWRTEFFDVRDANGVLPELDQGANVAGGHAVLVYKGIPPRNGYPRLFAFVQTWGPAWSDGRVCTVDPEARPGWGFLPEALFQNGVVWEARRLTLTATLPPPPPHAEGTP